MTDSWTTPLRAGVFNKVLQLIHKKADFDTTQSPMEHPVDSAYVLTRPPSREWKGAALYDRKGRLRPACIWTDLTTAADCKEAAAYPYRKYGYN